MWGIFIQIVGFASNVAFGLASAPAAYETLKKGRSVGTPVSLAWNIIVACLLFYVYSLATYGLNPVFLIGGLVEGTSYGIILWFHYFPRREK